MVFVGNVQTTFSEHHGNWVIDEDLERKVGLPHFKIDPLEEVTRITLWVAQGPKVSSATL